MKLRIAPFRNIQTAISGLDLEGGIVNDVIAKISADTIGLLLYGSRARGDFDEQSDYDILRLSASASHTFSIGLVSVSSYTPSQLASASGTLFGTHIARDGRILLDTDDQLKQIISSLEPADSDSLLQQVRRYSTIINLPDDEIEQHLAGLVRLVRYLYRTAVYARAMAGGRPCFSVRELAIRFDDPLLATLLSSNPAIVGPPTLSTFDVLRGRLFDEIGSFPPVEWGSLEEIGIKTWDTDRNVAALAIRAAAEDGPLLDYTDLPKVLL